MMLFSFVKDAKGNVIRLGAECDVPVELQNLHEKYSTQGYTLATAEEYDAQVIGGATKGWVKDPNFVPETKESTESGQA